MKRFFRREEEEIQEVEDTDELDVIDLDETSGWSMLEAAEEIAKKNAENMMEEIGDELAICDVTDEDVELEAPENSILAAGVQETQTQVSPEVGIQKTDEDLHIEELMENDDIEILTDELSDDDLEYLSMDEEDEEEDDGEESPFAFFENLGGMLSRFNVLDKVVAVTGVLVLLVAILTVGIYSGNRGVQKQVEALAPIGEQLETVGILGGDKLVAVADAKKAMIDAAKLEEELNQEYEENEISNEIKVVMKMTSVQKDLKIKFVNKKTGKLVGNIPFEVKITDASGKTYNKIDEDKDGIIYLTKIEPGNYSVAMVELEGLEGYSISTTKESIKVKENIDYKKIDVSDEIKDQSEVDVSKEDTAQKTETEGSLTDTVEWVESQKLPGNSQEVYTQVDKSAVADPSLSASAEVGRSFFSILGAMTVTDEDAALDTTTDTDTDTTTDTTTVSVTGITLSESSLNLKAGESKSLTATVTPENASDKTVTWSSDNPGVASVNGGAVTAAAAGTATITATAGGQSATCTVTVTAADVAVTGITLNQSSITLTAGSSVALTATVTPENATDKTVAWTSSDSNVATVSNGTVTAVSAGTATITATAGGQSATCAVTVNAATIAVSGVKLDQTSLSLQVGGTAALTAAVTPENATNKTVTWASSNANVATVSNGTVTAVSAGTATITATAGGQSAVCTVTVNAATIAVSEVKLNQTSLSLQAGETASLTATVLPDNATNKAVSWATSDVNVATVDSGKVTAVKAGTATITVTIGDKSASCTVTVTAAETSITLDKTTASMKTGETLTLKATVSPSGKTVTWKSSDESKATVSDGTVTAKAEGEVTITATADGKSAACKITVTKAYDPKTDTTTALKDKSGNQLYVLVNGEYVEAKAADYWKYSTFYKKETTSEYSYTGWQNIDGNTYYFDKNGNKVTGEQVIQGAKYNFNSDGTLNTGSGILGIDVSTWNGNIDWQKVKNSGVSYVIIRTGFRGSTQGSLVEDNKFRQNIQGATNAGLKVGVYFFSQAINEVEAVEEASMVLGQIKNYKITYPVFIDVEPSGGRADSLSAGERTKVINAFCQTIQNGGYRAGIYANKTWLSQKMNISALSGYKIWLAQYNSTVTYGGRYDMWQYSDKGTIPGISTKVDMNLSYMSY